MIPLNTCLVSTLRDDCLFWDRSRFHPEESPLLGRVHPRPLMGGMLPTGALSLRVCVCGVRAAAEGSWRQGRHNAMSWSQGHHNSLSCLITPGRRLRLRTPRTGLEEKRDSEDGRTIHVRTHATLKLWLVSVDRWGMMGGGSKNRQSTCGHMQHAS